MVLKAIEASSMFYHLSDYPYYCYVSVSIWMNFQLVKELVIFAINSIQDISSVAIVHYMETNGPSRDSNSSVDYGTFDDTVSAGIPISLW